MGKTTRYNFAESVAPPPKPSTSRPRIVIERVPNGVNIKRKLSKVASVKSMHMEQSRREMTTQDHLVPIEHIYIKLNTHPVRGLTYANVEANLIKYGANILSPLRTTSEWVKYIHCLIGGFAICLWLAAFLCFAVFFAECSYMDEVPSNFLYLGVALLVVIFISGSFIYLQEYNNDQIMESFKNMVPQYTCVIRNNYKIVLNVKELVMGDIVEVKAGDRIPADLRIIASQGLKIRVPYICNESLLCMRFETVDNSSLTGESEPLLRLPECTSDDPMETYNLAFFSTMAVEGTARGVVIQVGDKTLMGKIARLASGLIPVEAPLSKEMNYFVKILCARAVIIGIIFFGIAFSMGYGWFDSIFFLIGVIVANVPEGLLSFITVCLAISAKRMASKNCLVKHLQAVETLGSTSTICSDKTGTLTQNNMTVSHVWFNNHLMEVDTSELRTTDDRFDERNSDFRALAYVGMLCSRASFLPGQERFSPYDRLVSGDASESAILKFFETQIGNVENFRRYHPKMFEIPFNSTSKYQVSIHRINHPSDPHLLLVMKGAPEKILELCSTVLIDGDELELDDNWRETIETMQYTLGNLGERVFAFCDYRLPISYIQSSDFEVESDSPEFLQYGFRHVGLMSLMDPPRSKVPDAVLKCRSAGIRVVMVTGDHPATAKAIARSVGILTAGNETVDEMALRLNIDVNEVDLDRIKAAVIEGPHLRNMTDDELDAALRKYTEIVFARTTPQQKLAIVEALQRQNHVVAVTGDGVNDSPALKKADIGIAMGTAGSDISKETADMILLDDNFASIVTGVEEGRKIFDNLKKCSFYALTDNVAELVPFFIFVMLKVPLALGTIAMLMIDLGTDVLPAISLAYEKPDSDIMKQMPRNCLKERLITNKLISYAYGQIGMIQACAGFFAYLVILAQNGFWPNRILGIQPQWDSRAINDLEDSYGQEWTFQARKKLEYTCHTGYFIAVVVAQWANLIISKTRRVSIFDKGMSNWHLNFALVAETALAAFLSYCPGMDVAFKMYPLKFDWWFLPIPFALLVFVLDEARRFIIRNYKGSWIEEEFYY